MTNIFSIYWDKIDRENENNSWNFSSPPDSPTTTNKQNTKITQNILFLFFSIHKLHSQLKTDSITESFFFLLASSFHQILM